MKPHLQPYARLGAVVAGERARARWSQRELAQQADVSTGYIARIETGRNRPDPDVLRRLARAFNMDYADLATIAGYQNTPPVEPVSLSTLLRLRARFDALHREFEQAMGKLDARLTGDPTTVDDYVRREIAKGPASAETDEDAADEGPASGSEGGG